MYSIDILNSFNHPYLNILFHPVRITCGDRTRCPNPAGALEPRAPAEAEEER
jgi:hypothetical protein